tara:strand:- start:260 stop:454 length:195 start_codon:yes stop_codon:yes gene_type:complete
MKYIDHNYKKGGTQKDFYGSNDVEIVNCLSCKSEESSMVHKEFGNIGAGEGIRTLDFNLGKVAK